MPQHHAHRLGLILSVSTAAALAACAGKPATKQWITVAPVPQSTAATQDRASAGTASTLATPQRSVVVVRPVIVPEYLQSRAVRYRAAGALVAEFPHAVWAERPEVGLTRELGNALSQLAAHWQICTQVCDPQDSQALRVEWSTLEFRPQERLLVAHARWVLSPSRSPQPLKVATDGNVGGSAGGRLGAETQREADFNISAPHDDAQAMGMALGQLSQELARQIAQQAQ